MTHHGLASAAAAPTGNLSFRPLQRPPVLGCRFPGAGAALVCGRQLAHKNKQKHRGFDSDMRLTPQKTPRKTHGSFLELSRSGVHLRYRRVFFRTPFLEIAPNFTQTPNPKRNEP